MLKHSYGKFLRLLNDFEWENVHTAVTKINWEKARIVNLNGK